MAISFSKIDRSNLQIDFAHIISREEILRFQSQFEELAINRFPRAIQFVLNKTSRDAQEGLRDAVEQAFDNPVQFSRVNPDDLNRTSIRRWNRRVVALAGTDTAAVMAVRVEVPAGTKVVIRTGNTATAGAAADLGLTLSFQRLLSALLS